MQGYKKEIGRLGEEAVKDLYARNGFKILVRNFFNRKGKQRGEIDFIALKNRHLHFVEVKTRTSRRFGAPEESLTPLKKMRILLAIKFFLTYFGQFADYGLHIDVAGVQIGFDKTIEKIKITSDAIEEMY